MTSHPRQARVALLSHDFSSPNLGVGALSLSNLELVSEAASRAEVAVEFVVIGNKGDHVYASTPTVFESHRQSLRDLTLDTLHLQSALAKPIAECDLALDIGEGDSFADTYGAKRLASLMLTKHLVLRGNVPLILSPQTIGPFTRPLSRVLARRLLHRAALVFARDALSADHVFELAPRTTLMQVSDVAIALPGVGPRLPPADRPRVGFNVSGLLWNRGATFGVPNYADAMLSMVDAFLEADVDLHLVPHVESPGEPDDDRDVSIALHERFPSLHLPEPFASPIAAKAYISQLDLLVGARMHACIAALSTGVAVVPIAYSRKATGLFRGLGYPLVLDIAELEDSIVAAMILSAYAKRSQLSADARSASGVAVAQLDSYRDALCDWLDRVAR